MCPTVAPLIHYLFHLINNSKVGQMKRSLTVLQTDPVYNRYYLINWQQDAYFLCNLLEKHVTTDALMYFLQLSKKPTWTPS